MQSKINVHLYYVQINFEFTSDMLYFFSVSLVFRFKLRFFFNFFFNENALSFEILAEIFYPISLSVIPFLFLESFNEKFLFKKNHNYVFKRGQRKTCKIAIQIILLCFNN